jgi:adenylyltransferase/sulfurtransferase
MKMQERYSRQILFDGIGPDGQERLNKSTVLIVGAGALGTAQTEMLSRAGVGKLRVVDRDFVESSNLQRQTMFTEKDAADRIPKAIACRNHVAEINSDIEIEAIVADVNNSNVESLMRGVDIVLDGTDNFATRYLLNDACVKGDVPWVYGAAVGSYGVSMTIIPRETPCLRCVFEEAPAPGMTPTCDTAGVIMPIIATVVSVQVSEAIKLITGQKEKLHRSLLQFDLWQNEWRRIKMSSPVTECPTCQKRLFDWLDAESREFAASLCGRNSVQIVPSNPTTLDFASLAARLGGVGETRFNEYLFRLTVGEHELTVFRDARAIIRGTDDVTTAKSIYARYIGN